MEEAKEEILNVQKEGLENQEEIMIMASSDLICFDFCILTFFNVLCPNQLEQSSLDSASHEDVSRAGRKGGSQAQAGRVYTFNVFQVVVS